MGLSTEWRRTLHIAGLLHDIGKIGIPDSILRKPAPLTADEHDIVKQHVALGHMIVRDLPNLDLVRSGIRFHHEQWDGQRYLERLAGEEIPVVARILAVADALSAMTTTRPYRKALPVREALRRLEDAAGSQLDPALVLPFVRGMETASDAPIPGDERPITDLLTPNKPATPAWELPFERAGQDGPAAPGARPARTGATGRPDPFVDDDRSDMDDPPAGVQADGGHAPGLSPSRRISFAGSSSREAVRR